MSNSEKTLYLLGRYIDDAASSEECEALAILLQDPSCEEAARVYLQEALRVTAPMETASETRWAAIYAAIGGAAGTAGAMEGNDREGLREDRGEDEGGAWRADLRGAGREDERSGRRIYARWVAAAAVVAAIVLGIYLFDRPAGGSMKASVASPSPGRDVAMLTLSDGSKVALDSAHEGMLTQQGNTRITKQRNGQLTYKTMNEKPGTILMNTLSTPRGGQYRLVLPDGSGVWLNAASSITYPTAFTGRERKVTVSGEVYFEIAKHAEKPFRVTAPGADGKDMEVEVLGTQFNLNAYPEEDAVRTTLLEGSVRLLYAGSKTLLAPGQQGRVQRNEGITVIPDVDTEEVVAWKEGRFNFENADIREVMRQIERWYDVEVEYRGRITTEKFAGEISRSSNLTDVFKILELSNVHFKVEGKKVLVMP